MDQLKHLWTDNIAWLLPVIGLIGVAVTFAVAGAGWGLFGFILLLVLVIAVLANSYRLASKRASSAEEASAALNELVHAREDALKEEDGEPGEAAAAPEKEDKESRASESDSFVEAFGAAWKRDIAATQRFVDEAVKQAENDEDRVRRQAFGLALVARAGSAAALDELKARATENPTEYMSVRALGVAYDWLGDEQTAATEIQQRVGAFAGQERAELRVLEAEWWLDSGRSDEALVAADDALKTADTDNTRRSALKYRARALREQSRKVESFVAYEKALELYPADAALRFELAWFYGEERLAELAIVTYQKLIGLDPTQDMAINNYGWELSKAGMQVLAFAQYERAYAAGNSLAASNLAQVLGQSGAQNEAKAWITKGRALTPAHSRVETIAGALEREHEDEKETLSGLVTEASLQRKALREMSDQPARLPEGQWRLSTGGQIDLVPTEFGQASGKTTLGEALTFEVDGNSMQVKRVKSYSTRRGFAFWRGSVLAVFLIRSDERGHEYIELTPEGPRPSLLS